MDYINALVSRLSAESTSDFKLFERPLLRLCQVSDKFQLERVKRICQKLSELFKTHLYCFLAMDQITELVLKLALRSPAFSAAFAKQPDLYKAIDRFHKDFPTLPVGNSGKVKVFKEGNGIRWNDISSNFLNKQSK